MPQPEVTTTIPIPAVMNHALILFGSASKAMTTFLADQPAKVILLSTLDAIIQMTYYFCHYHSSLNKILNGFLCLQAVEEAPAVPTTETIFPKITEIMTQEVSFTSCILFII